ncbi:transcription factor bHLH94-like [Silene latifolia]|uniref:transcription factor bHLH94-like n=1 Tax=Silene latifolia TaxID=37657 RepID=UPI003D77DEE7
MALHQQHLFALNNTLLDTWSTPITCLDDIIIPQIYENYNYNFIDDYNGISNYNNNNNNNYNYDITNVGFSTLNEYECGLDDSSPELAKSSEGDHGIPMAEVVMRPRRRRATAKKNKEDIENQRMTHIAVERNRRKQMNEYLKMLRSLMPDSYVQRGDQASIVGGAINFVKELEHNLHYLSAKKHIMENLSNDSSSTSTLPFQEFFTFPQYSTSGHSRDNNDQTNLMGAISQQIGGGVGGVEAEVEVTMVESHANLKIRMKQQPKQLSKLVSGLLCLRFTILHLNVNTAEGLVFYSFNLKVEDNSKMSTVDEIAGAVYNLLCRIQEEQASLIY